MELLFLLSLFELFYSFFNIQFVFREKTFNC